MAPRLFFEDFAPGSSALYPGPAVTRDEIVAFAARFDPQPFHLDEAAARRTFAGELIASGWHTCALTMRMIADGFILEAAGMGAPGVEEVRWLRPVRPGDTLSTRAHVLEARPSRSRPDRGLVRFRFEVLNQAGEPVMTQVNWILLGRRGHGADDVPRSAEAVPAREALPRASAEPRGDAPPGPPSSPFLDDVAPDVPVELGAHRFEAEGIIDFARRYDPQPFHVDPEAARRSHFGGLIASGWHTAAAWMRVMILGRERARDAALARGEPPSELGPSPGFTDLRWPKPVYAGDTVAYRSALIERRPSRSRPGWDLAVHHNTGLNQRGEEVFSFRSSVFWRR